MNFEKRMVGLGGSVVNAWGGDPGNPVRRRLQAGVETKIPHTFFFLVGGVLLLVAALVACRVRDARASERQSTTSGHAALASALGGAVCMGVSSDSSDGSDSGEDVNMKQIPPALSEDDDTDAQRQGRPPTP